MVTKRTKHEIFNVLLTDAVAFTYNDVIPHTPALTVDQLRERMDAAGLLDEDCAEV